MRRTIRPEGTTFEDSRSLAHLPPAAVAGCVVRGVLGADMSAAIHDVWLVARARG